MLARSPSLPDPVVLTWPAEASTLSNWPNWPNWKSSTLGSIT